MRCGVSKLRCRRGTDTLASTRWQLEFWNGREGSDRARRVWQHWSWRGDLVSSPRGWKGCLRWNDYPNAFERIAGALDHRRRHAVVDGGPGCEFEVPGGEAHVGGASHGGLHALESLCPFIIAGPSQGRSATSPTIRGRCAVMPGTAGRAGAFSCRRSATVA